ncbi:translation initiation factor eIF-1A [Patescibacteria group bacterium]|nr:translation initiation factor eIF-1A [Patescibacteria group bacterium]
MNKKGNRKGQQEENPDKVIRVRLPRGEEMLGIIEQRLGGNKMFVNCLDGKKRNCRVPGRLKRALWLRPGDTVIIEPWELDKEKGDVIFKYRINQVNWLKERGYLKSENLDEF